MRAEKWLATLWLLSVLLCAMNVRRALAHAGEESVIQLSNVRLGAYHLTVLTAPRTPLVGSFHVVIQVVDERGRPQVIREMMVAAIPLSRPDDTQVNPALPIAPPVGNHEAQLELAEIGRYQIQIRVAGSAPPVTSETVTFEVEVVSGLWIQGLLIILVSITAIAALWLLWEGFIVWRR